MKPIAKAQVLNPKPKNKPNLHAINPQSKPENHTHSEAPYMDIDDLPPNPYSNPEVAYNPINPKPPETPGFLPSKKNKQPYPL